VIRRTLIIAAALTLTAVCGVARADSSRPFGSDPIGPLSDVTGHWRDYQPARSFCVRPSAVEYAAGGVGATATGRDRACRRSGFPRAAKHLVRVHVHTPGLCSGCRRLFIDFTKIPPRDRPARGHAYYHLDSINNTYTVDSSDHSPNTKDFTNDKLIAPDGSPQAPVIGTFDLHAIAYVTDTEHFIHTAAQGPYYIGPWYLSAAGERIHGVYLDVNVADAVQLPDPTLNAIGYFAGFNSGDLCPNDDDAYYAGCFDWWGVSAETVDPFNG
jgi:hypothetical protein